MQLLQIMFIVGIALVMGVAVLWFMGRPRTDRFAEERARLERELALAVEAGTHGTDGRRLCKVRGCRLPAELPPVAVRRAEGLWAWMRQQLGAPARYRAEWNPFKPRDRCHGHGELAMAEARAFLLDFELERLKSQRNAELELARFEAVGLDERIDNMVQKQEERITR